MFKTCLCFNYAAKCPRAGYLVVPCSRNDAVATSDCYSNATIKAWRRNTDLHVEMLHTSKTTLQEPVRVFGDLGLQLRHPRLCALRTEEYVNVRLGLDSD